MPKTSKEKKITENARRPPLGSPLQLKIPYPLKLQQIKQSTQSYSGGSIGLKNDPETRKSWKIKERPNLEQLFLVQTRGIHGRRAIRAIRGENLARPPFQQGTFPLQILAQCDMRIRIRLEMPRLSLTVQPFACKRDRNSSNRL